MEDQVAIKIAGLGKKYSLSEKKIGINLSERLKDFFLFKRKTDKTPKEFYALKDIHLEIPKGCSVGIIGRNGAGKSTLLKILSEVVEATEGRIEINGKVASVLEVGMGFHPELTGRENVFLNGIMLGLSRNDIEKKFDEIVKFSGVEKFIDTPVKHYSSGMYVRLAFSIVANIDADILLFDEVLSVGDSEFHMKILQKIHELKKIKTTIVMVSHNMNDIMKCCEKTILLNNGRLEKAGNTGEVTAEYFSDVFQHDLAEQDKKKTLKENKVRSNASEISAANSENEHYLVNKFSVYSAGKTHEEPIISTDKIIIELDIKKKTDTGYFDFAFTISHYDNIFLICSSANKTHPIKNKGSYKITSTLPDNFFNESLYIVDIHISLKENKDNSDFIFYTCIPSAKTFYVHGKFPQDEKKFFGPVRLRNTWEIEEY